MSRASQPRVQQPPLREWLCGSSDRPGGPTDDGNAVCAEDMDRAFSPIARDEMGDPGIGQD